MRSTIPEKELLRALISLDNHEEFHHAMRNARRSLTLTIPTTDDLTVIITMDDDGIVADAYAGFCDDPIATAATTYDAFGSIVIPEDQVEP